MARPKRPLTAQKKNVVGSRVREARLSRQPEMDQIDLATSMTTATGTTYGRTTISRLESGHRPVTDFEIIALAKILEVDVRWLLLGQP